MEEWWVEQIHEACERYDVKFFFKQWGGKRKKKAGRVFKKRTWNDYPVAVAQA
jgi:protein gp37